MKVKVLSSLAACNAIKFISKYSITNPKQIKLRTLINDNNLSIVIADGFAGSGKTMISCLTSIEKLKQSTIDKIVITRPAVTNEENLGFLPGNIEDKLYPFVMPIYDYFLEYYTQEQLNNLILNRKIEISPLAYMRGRTFKNSIIIADEMQNATPAQMKMILTRIGIGSKLIITGDTKQSDLKSTNGLEDLLALLKNKYSNEEHMMYQDGFGYIHLDSSCIQRHEIIEKVIELYK
jgi:phosphate starvation-inducible PhoH-like protein